MSKENNSLGDFSPYSCEFSEDNQAIFKEALEGILGIRYTPVAISQQVVAGMNYRFFCNTKPATEYTMIGTAIVSIYKPLG